MVALAEKAYAPWNDTGRAGRDGTNSYAGIEGGWMSDVNFQILGYNSTNYSFTTTTQQTLINAVGSGQAVTAGTKATVASGLVATHAYSITAYNSSTGRFTLHNPWGNTHPAPLTWGELQANFSMFTTTAPQGSGGEVVSNGFRSQLMVMGLPNMEESRLVHRMDFGSGLVRTEELQPIEGGDSVLIVTSGIEQLTADAFATTDQPMEKTEALLEDSKEIEESASSRSMKDLALVELYLNAISRSFV